MKTNQCKQHSSLPIVCLIVLAVFFVSCFVFVIPSANALSSADANNTNSTNNSISDTESIVCTAGDVSIPDAEIGQPILYSMSITNNGKTAIAPNVSLDIWNQDKTKLVFSKEILFEESNASAGTSNISKGLLPSTSKLLTAVIDGNSDNKLIAGQYWAYAIINPCQESKLVSFNIIEIGAVADAGELIRIENAPQTNPGKTIPITAVFKNTGQKTVSAKLKATIYFGNELVDSIDSDYVDVAPDETANITIHFTSETAGKYDISGKILFNDKSSYEKTSVLNVEGSLSLFNWRYLLIFAGVIFIAIVATVKLIRKIKKRRHHNMKQNNMEQYHKEQHHTHDKEQHSIFGFLKKKTKQEIKLICFDLDNTLENYGPAEAETEAYFAEMIAGTIKNAYKTSAAKSEKNRNKKEAPLKLIRPIDVLNIFNEVKRSHMHHALKPEEFSRAFWFRETITRLNIDENIKGRFLNEKYLEKMEEHYWSYLTPKLKLFPHSAKLLEELKSSQKYKLVLLTDSDGKKIFKLRRIKFLGLEKYFDYLITTDLTGLNKPAIENFEYILKISGMKGENCMMIGDHPDVDLINAKKLNFSTVWTKQHLNTDQHLNYVDYEIHDIIEVLDVLKKREK